MRNTPGKNLVTGDQTGPTFLFQWLEHQIEDDPHTLHAAEHTLLEVGLH